MNKLVKFLVALTDPEIFAAIGVVVGLIVACIFGGHQFFLVLFDVQCKPLNGALFYTRLKIQAVFFGVDWQLFGVKSKGNYLNYFYCFLI